MSAQQTTSEAAWTAAEAQLKPLLGDHRFVRTTAVMIFAQRLYALSRIALREIVAERLDEPELPEALAVRWAREQSHLPTGSPGPLYEEIATVISTILPAWLESSLAAATRSYRAALAKEMAEEEAARIAAPVPTGVPWREPSELARDRPLVFVGSADVLASVRELVLAETRKDPGLGAVCVGPGGGWPESLWRGCTNTKKALGPLVSALFGDPEFRLDLLICTDLAALRTCDYAARPGPAIAGDSLKFLFNLCKAAGAALIGFAEATPEQAAGFAAEALRTFSWCVEATRDEAGGLQYVLR